MATIAIPAVPEDHVVKRSRLKWAVSDTATMTVRNLISYTRIPEALFFSTLQPIMFVLLLRYVFGGSSNTPGTSYVNYLMPGIIGQSAAFGSFSTQSSST